MNDVKSELAGGGQEPAKGLEGAPKKKKSGGVGWLLLVVVLVIIAVVALDRVGGVNIFTTEEERQREKVEEFLAETGAWHAVFLTNGQVYFGQLENPEAQFATLKDIYYLQIQQVQTPPPPQPQEGEGSQVIPAPQPQPARLTLIKFGTELHGPQDYMKINRDHILFWEELKADSQVVQAIQRYKESQQQGEEGK